MGGAIGDDFNSQIQDMRRKQPTFYKSAFGQKKSRLTSRLTTCSAKKLPDLLNSVPRG